MSQTQGGSDPKDLLYMFYRPVEPIFIGKGDENVTFELPRDYLTDRYKPLVSDIQSRFPGSKTVTIRSVQKLPDISRILQLDRHDNLSLFIPYHRELAAQLVSILMGLKSFDEFQSVCAYCRDRVNPYLFIYAMSVAVLHRPDTKNLQIPSLCEIFPEKFMDSSVFLKAREEAIVVPTASRMAIEIPRDYSASDLDIEHRVAYFREDIGVNLHHWYWHLIYPFEGPRNIINKDRRGELFYYMHEQILGRYNFERISNRLGRTKRLLNLREEIPEGYFPKLDSTVASRVWPARVRNATLSDIDRESEQLQFDIADLERWRDRILEAIHMGAIITSDGLRIELDEAKGIDILGNIMESSILSVNRDLYGDLHNRGHVAIALCHDPDHRYLENISVMGDPTTAMRDPVFYRWHAMIDYIFQEHKNKLPQYTVKQLTFDGIKINNVEVQIQSSSAPKNEFATFWQQNDIDLSRGLDFAPGGQILARFTHLQHAPFVYKILVDNTSSGNATATVRIFLAPKQDERGVPFLFNDQRSLFIELDKFVTTLKKGQNLIERRSIDSAVTLPFEYTFRNLSNMPTSGPEAERWNYCGCGWPQHLLIPKGSPEGLPCDLFVMISNWAEDKVDDAKSDVGCDDASSYCGRRDSKYPDKRSMGFPFDRRPRQGVANLKQFLTPNMFVLDTKIKFTDRIIPPSGGTFKPSIQSSGNRPKNQQQSGSRSVE
nr:prophenoloxidase-1 [Bemisia tabaci]